MNAFSKTSMPPILRLIGSSDVPCMIRSETSMGPPPLRLVRRRRMVPIGRVEVPLFKGPEFLIASRRSGKAKRRKSKG